MGGSTTFSSPPRGGEGRAAKAAKGEGAVPLLTAPSPSLGFASHFPLPLKGVRGFGVASQRDQDRSQDAVEVRHHVGIGEPDHSVAECFEELRSGSVIGLALIVSVAVELDDQAVRSRCEIGDVRGQDDLALELHAEAVRSKVVPETAFGLGEVFAQFLCAGSCFGVPFQIAPSPRSAARSRPLPLKGARGSVRHSSNSFQGSSAVNA